jgi:acid stress-induced BolA-like protein IbaG/YrbA
MMRCVQRLHTTSPQTANNLSTWRSPRYAVPRQAFTAVHSIPVSGPGFSSASTGQMDSELITTITGKISTALETDRVNVIDVNGDGRHISVAVVSPIFEGKNLVQRQRMVYKVKSRTASSHWNGTAF